MVQQQNAMATASDAEEQLVVSSMECTYLQLLRWVLQIDFSPLNNNNNDPRSPRRCLPLELSNHVASFLTLSRVNPATVEAVSASSMDDTFQLSSCLQDNEDSWWLSAEESMPRGQGAEYVEFRLCPQPQTQCRLTAVHIRIPPLPLGPLSVRDFRMDVLEHQGGTWRQITSQQFRVDNRRGMQRFNLEKEVDAQSARVVCLSNQISPFLSTRHAAIGRERVGFYAVRFE